MRGQEHIQYRVRITLETEIDVDLIKPPCTAPMDDKLYDKVVEQVNNMKIDDFSADIEIVGYNVWEDMDDDEMVDG